MLVNSTAEIVILIPHYNNPEGLKKSLQTIQEESNINILIVDDGSKKLPINESALQDNLPTFLHLNYIYLEKNRGIEEALNTGLRHILSTNYTYIARLDCGDLCAPGRFLKQKKFMEDHPGLGLVGSYVHFIDSGNNWLYDLKPPTGHEQIKRKMHVNAMFIHPSIMLKTEVIKEVGVYPTTYQAAEDFAFFFKIIKQFKTANIPEFLVSCEVNTGGISLTRRKEQLASRMQILKEEFYWGFYPCYGLVRNFIISKLPYSLIHKIKKTLR